MERRVVITGLGALTPVGNNTKEFWGGLKEGKCGIDNITAFDTTDFKVKLAAELKNYDAEKYFDKREARRLDKFSQYAMIAAREAWEDSKLDKETQNMERVGISLGSGIGGINTIESEKEKCILKGPDRVSPMYIPMGISNMAAGNVAIDIGIKGESTAIVTACATGTHCIGEAFRTIKYGYQDVMLAGGTEASITPLSIAGFSNIKALSRTEDKTRASIPFDKERNGFVMGEGGARAMKLAIEEAKISPRDITYINAHGTSTHLNDACETMAVKKVFKEDVNRVMVSSTKGHTGHLLGAAGAIEAIACCKAIEDNFVPATLNYKVPDEECDLNLICNEGKKAEVKYAMSNSLGFGGHNSSIVFKKYQDK